jgi:hypothetical protein
MPRIFTLPLLGIGCLFVLSLVGCQGTPSDGSVSVTGKLTSGGQPLVVQSSATGEGWVELRFYPQDASGNINDVYHQVMVSQTGEFKVPGPSNRGLPPGKYRVVVRQWDPYPVVDKLQGKFDETNSKIVQEVVGPTTIDLDLAKQSP